MKTGILLYEGPSLIDRAPIFAVACGRRSGRPNRKTGPAIQTYILRSDVAPNEAAKNGQDRSICGDCRLRPSESGVCYVELGKGVHWTFDAYKRGRYSYAKSFNELKQFFGGEYLRLGTYGDPAAVPFSAWDAVLRLVANHSGYTHQWRSCDERYRSILMASVESAADAAEAQSKGWRTFRMRSGQEAVGPGEIVCPGSDEGGRRLQCCTCRACTGNHRRKGAGRSVVIQVHGRPWKEAQFRRLMSLPMVNGKPKSPAPAPAKIHPVSPMPPRPAATPRRSATYPLDSGQVLLDWSHVKAEELNEVQDWLCMMVEKMKRDARQEVSV